MRLQLFHAEVFMFNAQLTINDSHSENAEKTYSGTGESVYDAISNIPTHWSEIRTKGVVKVSDGSKEVEKLFYLRNLRMMFANHLRRQGFARQFEDMLKHV